MNLTKLTNEELFGVLLCGQAPIENATIQDYVDEWNKRCKSGTNKDGNGYAIPV